MARKATGSAEWHNGRWQTRLSVKGADGKTHRPWVDLEAPELPNTPKGHEQAKKLAAIVASRAHKSDRVFVGKGDATEPEACQSIAALADKWFDLLKRDQGDIKGATIYDYTGRLRSNILPVLGELKPPLTVLQLRSFFRTMKATREVSTVRNTANAMTKFLDACRAEGWVAGENPMRSRDVRAH